MSKVKESIKTAVFRLIDGYHQNAGLQFTIYDYNLYELCREGGNSDPKLTAEFRRLIGEYYNGKECKVLADELRTLRNAILARMEAVSAYTDRFTIYEYILNRMELKYSGQKELIDDETETTQLLQRIFSGNDTGATNLKLQMMLSQLPIRMTRAKFMDRLSESLSFYENHEQESVEKFLYLLRSAAGIYAPKAMEEFTELAKAEAYFAAADYKVMEEMEYLEYTDRMQDVVAELNEWSEYYTSLQETVNQFYVMLLTKAMAGEQSKKEATRIERISLFIQTQIGKEEQEELPDEQMELFRQIEGRLEQQAEQIARGAAVRDQLLDYTAKELNEAGLYEAFAVLELCVSLNSGSLFVNLEEEDNIEPADHAYIEKRTGELQRELEAAMEGKDALQKRAMMAAVLKELPVFFESRNDVSEYIKCSLANCKDYSEKRISLDLLQEALDEISGY